MCLGRAHYTVCIGRAHYTVCMGRAHCSVCTGTKEILHWGVGRTYFHMEVADTRTCVQRGHTALSRLGTGVPPPLVKTAIYRTVMVLPHFLKHFSHFFVHFCVTAAGALDV